MKYFYTFFFCLIVNFSFSQDAYHQNLNEWLMTSFNLPEAEWIVADTETAIYDQSVSYGCIESAQDIADQDFSRADRVVISNPGNNPWDAGWKVENNTTIQSGEKLLLVLWVRSLDGDGKANIFVERTSNFVKEIYLTANITEEWTPYYIPFEATTGNYEPGQLALGFHLSLETQTLEIGGFTVINYGASISLNDLPSDLNNDLYEGHESDSEWRGFAADRIEQFRKANLTIHAETTDGTPIPDAAFDVEMQQHEFAFGSAITAERIAGNNNQNVFYENRIANLDGNGHGFNWVVFENDLKWDGWEEEWFVSHAELVNAVDWLHERNIKIRGHTLIWPGFQFLPDDIVANAGDADYVWNRIDGRLDEILNYPGLEADKIPEWDVLNEIAVNNDLEATFQDVPGNTTGREFYAEIFERAKELSPETKMYINDYVTMSLNNTGGGLYDVLKARIQELQDAGAPIEGIGFQGHIGGFPNGIPSVLATLDDFYTDFGLTTKITEFDLPTIVSEELAANYLRDFMTAIFSHESTDGFLFWSFWDGATYMNPGANLFREDWSRTPAGDMFVDLVFNQWWTDTLQVTDMNGDLTTRAYKGLYNISYVCDGEMVTETINLTEDQTLNIVCDQLQTSTISIDRVDELTFTIRPNPASQYLKIERVEERMANLILYNMLGIKVFEQTVSGRQVVIPVQGLSGTFIVELNNENGKSYQKVIIN